MPKHTRRYFTGGSDARVVMGEDEEALYRLWREKRGEVEPKDLSGNLVVQLQADREVRRVEIQHVRGDGRDGFRLAVNGGAISRHQLRRRLGLPAV